ncbi:MULTISPECIES: anti-sigma factor [unclassified Bradyrhizobium]|uniref:anti-sigma factor n=1 Tax=unclassified Bradyrhizobium TaxID=2631580 RepID=UPI002478C1C2|nr:MULTISPECIES: anti-sigma factor [unclassified Bradyrhizobium]WGR73366.1 anti-sigma factor [Bradyrhizobium sp. ISRA426]WGR78203.1 anti-sigma factor [Bradyrhizobium sp. ISRA430]WGR88604.1 anti-sigma factor [Bradyrhizobium sp. ISRA432]
MADTEDHIALAAEYALGTLEADERAQVEAMMAVDKDFAAIVQAWEFRLGTLNQMVGSVEPRPIVWDNIRFAIAQAAASQQPSAAQEPPVAQQPPATQEPTPLLDAPPPVAPEPVREAQQAASDVTSDFVPQFVPQVHAPDPHVAPVTSIPVVDGSNVIRLESRLKRWRGIASAAGALAAALLVTLSLQIFQPDALPVALRPAPVIRTVEVKTPAAPFAPPSQYVALLQGPNGGPAFILTIDGATRNFTVRKVGATPEPGKSFELWLISDKLPRPRSLGVIGANDFTARPVLASYDAEVVNTATYAVTVEQAGGSPSGQPTSAPVFSGKLIETVPPPQPQAPARK